MRIVVVGGGVAGLAAALRVRERRPGVDLVLIEQASRLGGKVHTGLIAGRTAETAAEAVLTRDPGGGDSAAVTLVHRLGLAERLRYPAAVNAAIAVGGRLWPLPSGTVLGVPGSRFGAGGPGAGSAGPGPGADWPVRVDRSGDTDTGHPVLDQDEDVAVGRLVRRRLGDQVVDRLVDPLLGGVYAGRADELSLAATVPALARACRKATTLTAAADAALAARGGVPAGPAFATLAGGLSQLIDAAAAALRTGPGGVPHGGTGIRLGLPVRQLRRTDQGWRLTIGSTRSPGWLDADAVILATPGRPAARLLGEVSGAAAAAVGSVDYASIALVTLALPAAGLPALSGFLVPATEGYAVKAVTFLTTKWPHLRGADGMAVLRASIGRYGAEEVLQRDDADLVGLVRSELPRLLGRELPDPVDASVHRWGGALPQYTPGHLDRVTAARAALSMAAPAVALAGAAYDGVGIPACVRSGQAAADHVIDALGGFRS